MSQIPPESKPTKTRYRWLWLVLAMFCFIPVMMIMGLIGLYAVRSQSAEHDRQLAAWQLQEARRIGTTQSTPASSPVLPPQRKRAQIVRIQLDFEDFETRYANAITVDRDAQGSRLMVPSAVFAPMSGKINGRIVIRAAGAPKVVEVSGQSPPGGGMGMAPMSGGPGMAGATMGGSPAGARVAIPGIGLTELTLNNWDLTPIRVVGDFPEASIGDQLTVASLPEDFGFGQEVTVLGTDESVQLDDGSKLDHLLKLTEWTGTIGALLTNGSGEPIGQIIFTKPGKLRYSYAVPMNRIFQAIYDHKQQGNSALPTLEGRSPFTSEKKEDGASPVTTIAPELPPDPLQELAANAHAKDAPSLDVFAPTPVPPRAEPSLTELPAETLPPGNPRVPDLTPAENTPADASRPDPSIDQETKVYYVFGPAQEIAETLRSLYGDVAKIAANRTSRSVITVATPAVQARISATIEDLSKRAQSLDDEQSKLHQLERERMMLGSANQRSQMDAARASVATKEVVAEENHQKSPPGTAMPPLSEGRQQAQLDSEQDREAKQLALQLRTAAPSDQPTLRAKLEQLTEQQFRKRQDLRKKEIDDLSNRIDQLRVTQLRRQQNQAEIIRRRIEELLDPNSDLRWELPQDVQKAPASKSVVGESPKVLSSVSRLPAETEEPKEVRVEQTFDGVTYSQWLKILETEVKPTKLAAAIEACGRLAVSADRRRIAKMILRKANLSDAAAEVWNAADDSLSKFPMTDVIDEILISLADPESAERGRTFQGVFLLHYPKAVKERELELVAGLVKAVQENREDRNCLLAAACHIWQLSEHQLQDFDGLQPLVMQRFESAVEAKSIPDNDWYAVAYALLTKNPETPDLALKLMKLAMSADGAHFVLATNLIHFLGRHAEPAVPIIVDQILTDLKELEVETGPERSGSNNRQSDRVILLVRLLGNIRVGSQAAILLKELNLIASQSSPSNALRSICEEAQTAIEHFEEIPTADAPKLLSDPLLARGIWKIKSVNGESKPEYDILISRNEFYWGHRQGDTIDSLSSGIDAGPRNGVYVTGKRLQLDPTKSPKTALFELDGNRERKGVYELTESTLKIYVGPAQQPGPSQMIKDASEIPEGYLLLELQRSLSMPVRR